MSHIEESVSPGVTALPRDSSGLANPSRFGASLHLFGTSLRRQFLTPSTLICALLTALTCLLVVLWSKYADPNVRRFAERIIMPIHVAFLLPVYAICYGASAIGGEREDRTLVYLLITPLPRPLIYLIKYTCAVVLVLAWTIVSLVGLCALAGPWVRQALGSMPTDEALSTIARSLWSQTLGVFWPAALLGALAYASLFHALGAALRRGTIISLGYVFFLELLLGNMPGIVKRVSLSFYISCMIYDAGSEYGIGPRLARDMFLPIPGRTAALVLGSVSVALLVAGLSVFTCREYRDLS